MSYEAVIGLEIHVELDTASKIFCGCPTTFGAAPNTNVCPICMGMPGTLPVLNEDVVKLAIKAGLALDCDISMTNKTDRKNYFYPDLPKAYQISQFDMPICEKGVVKFELDGKEKSVGITRIHIEEDPGKMIHTDDGVSLVDYNRSGVALIEIVTEPDIRSAEEAVAFLKTLKSILQYSEVSDCRMEQGSLRCDANISIRDYGDDVLNTKVEIKNLNSFKEVGKALQKEYKRQSDLTRFDEGHKIKQETRKWDAAKGRTMTMRTKEDAHDYRFFPEPDLPPIILEKAQVEAAHHSLPELPDAKRVRFHDAYELSSQEIEVLISEKFIADYFEEVVEYGSSPKKAANWVIVEGLRLLKSVESEEIPVKPSHLAKLIELVEEGTVSVTAAKEVFEALVKHDEDPLDLIERMGLRQNSSADALTEILDEVLAAQAKAIEDYHSGRPESVGFLMGQIMKATKGQANPRMAKELLLKKLASYAPEA